MRYPNLGQGPWDNEPDRVEFMHGQFACVVARMEGGHLCGYVRVPDGHPLAGVGCMEQSAALAPAALARHEMPRGKMSPMTLLAGALKGDDERNTPEFVFDVHGGLTYSGECPCGWYVVSPRSGAMVWPDNDGWWFGFACAHAGDMSPERDNREAGAGWPYGRSYDDTYRTVYYVEHECRRLAEQLAVMSPMVEDEP